MKKAFAILALVGVMSSCKDKKKDEKKSEETSTTTSTTTPDATSAIAGVPTFSDPEVQKFANDYTAFAQVYKTGIMDPAKAQEFSLSTQEWATKMQSIVMKLASNPEEMKKWDDWMTSLSKEMMPAAK